ncbi:MAG: glycosyl transferase [Mycobacteriales bacterium]
MDDVRVRLARALLTVMPVSLLLGAIGLLLLPVRDVASCGSALNHGSSVLAGRGCNEAADARLVAACCLLAVTLVWTAGFVVLRVTGLAGPSGSSSRDMSPSYAGDGHPVRSRGRELAGVVTRTAGACGAPLVFLALGILANVHALTDLSRRTRCPCGDQGPFDWFLGWTPHAVLSGHAPWTSDYISVPHGVNLMWNTAVPLPAMLLTPVTLTAGPLASHTVLAVLGFAGSATAMWWAVGRWAPWWAARFAAGLLYGFSPYMVGQGGGHPNLQLVVVPPLMLIALNEVLIRQRRPSIWSGSLLGLLALAQLFITEEVLASMLLVAGVGLAVLVGQHRAAVSPGRAGHAAKALLVAAGVLTLGAGWPLYVQFFGPNRLTAPVHDVSPYAADLLGLVVPSTNQVLGTSITSTWAGNQFENGSYLGGPLVIALGLLAWRHRRHPMMRFSAILSLALWVLSLGDRLHVAGVRYSLPLPFAAVSTIPVLRNLVAVRFSLYVALFAAVMVAIGLDRLRDQGWTPSRRLWAILAIAACVVPLLPRLPYSYQDARTPTYFTSAAVLRIPPGAVAFTYPVPRFPASAAMQWQALAGFRYRSIGGYVISRGPDGAGTFAGAVTTWERVVNQAPYGGALASSSLVKRLLLREMSDLRCRAVLVADVPGAASVDALVGALLHRPPDDHSGGVSAWYLPAGRTGAARR